MTWQAIGNAVGEGMENFVCAMAVVVFGVIAVGLSPLWVSCWGIPKLWRILKARKRARDEATTT